MLSTFLQLIQGIFALLNQEMAFVSLNQVKFLSYGHMSFFTFLFTCTHVWSILEEVVGGKMPRRIIVLIGNDY